MKYSLGLDLGIASIGWALMLLNEQDEFVRIENVGVRLFDCLEDGKTGKLDNVSRRMKRGQRRLRRRKRFRLDKFLRIYEQYFGYSPKNIISDNNDEKRKSSTYVYDLKVKGLQQALPKDELAIALYHYVKYRGFKSNRKIVEEEKSKKVKDKDSDGILLQGISNVRKILEKEHITVTQYILNNYQQYKRVHNSEDNYLYTFDRKMYEDEITLLLDKQIEFKVINHEFKDQFLELWSRQRDFSDGPDAGTYSAPKGESLISRMVGICQFDKQMRAPKAAYSSELFVLLSFLNNLRFKVEYGDYRRLTANEINTIIDKVAHTKKDITYKVIFKTLGIETKNLKVKGLEISTKKKRSLLAKFKEQNQIMESDLTFDQYNQFQDIIFEELMNEKTPSLKNYLSIRKALQTALSPDTFKQLDVNKENYDKIAEILTLYKTDTQIEESCKKVEFNQEVIEAIKKLESYSSHINLSLKICKEINPELAKGNTYDQAMKEAGYIHVYNPDAIAQESELPPLEKIIEELGDAILSPNVRHMLVEARKVINAIIKEYGIPEIINVELARELSKNHNERIDERNQQLNNAEENMRVKTLLYDKYRDVFQSKAGPHSISRQDIIRYRLFLEQKGICPYSLKTISERDIFNRELYEVDHIIPYSRSFDDSFQNKVLVLKKSNQEKKNQTPYEAFKGDHWLRISSYIKDRSQNRMSPRKREHFLAKTIEEDFSSRNMNDTRYASRLLNKIITTYLKPKENIILSGQITNHLKTRWGLNGLQHSLINPTMENIYHYKLDLNDDYLLVTDNKVEIKMLVAQTQEKVTFTLNYIRPSRDKELKYFEMQNNQLFQFVSSKKQLIMNAIEASSCQTIDKLYEYCYAKLKERQDHNNQTFFEDMISLLNQVLLFITREKTKKNRDNHLHHAVDAVVIACCNQRMVKRVTEYHKRKELMELRDDIMSQDEIDDQLGIVSKSMFPLPYENFKDDVKNRIYQRDVEALKDTAMKIGIVGEGDKRYLKNLTILYPSRSPITKRTGPLHAETIYGETQGVITKRISVRSLKKSDLEKIANPSGGNDAVISAVREWFENTSEEEKKTTYPILPQKGSHIKKVKLEVSDVLASKIKLGDKRYVESEDVLRVNVYKSINPSDDKLYFAAFNLWNLEKEKKGNTQDLVLFWSRSEDGHRYIKSSDLLKDYIIVSKIKKGALVQIEKRDGSIGNGYVIGFSTGKLEIESVLGDGTDFVNDGLFSSVLDRYPITVSTIKSIKVLGISILGKIN